MITVGSILYTEIQRFLILRMNSCDDAEDLCQEVFERVLARSSEIDDTHLRAYCFAAARHALIDYYRHRTAKNRMMQRISDAGTGTFSTVELEKEVETARTQVASWIPERMHALPDMYRQPLELFELQRLSIDDIARTLHITPSNVKVRIHRARRLLQQAIDACCRILRDSTGRVIDYERRVAGTCNTACSCDTACA